jgi:hypothetical protein
MKLVLVSVPVPFSTYKTGTYLINAFVSVDYNQVELLFLLLFPFCIVSIKERGEKREKGI